MFSASKEVFRAHFGTKTKTHPKHIHNVQKIEPGLGFKLCQIIET